MSQVNMPNREVRSFLMARDPSVDRRFRPRPQKKLRLFDEIHESDEISSNESGTELESDYLVADDEATKSTTANDHSEYEQGPLVYLRLRPVKTPSTVYSISQNGNTLITTACGENNSNVNVMNKNNMEKHYSFTSIFDSQVGQRDIFEKCIGQKLQEEESFTILTYGTSGSGKTYTLLGDDVRAGLLPRSLEGIFTFYGKNIYPQPSLKIVNGRMLILEDDIALKEMQLRRNVLSLCPDIQLQYMRLKQIVAEDHCFEVKELNDVSVVIWVSFVEIYNEQVYDLLTPPIRHGAAAQISEPPRKSLKIICNKGEVFIKGLTSIYVRSSEEALKLLRFGLQRVNYASTAVNANSSRSHFVFFIDILKFYNNGETTQISYKFCDLAGSERVDKTGTIGSRLKEAQRINTSLMVLGRCLVAASQARKKNNDVIPFRESKLTMILQAPLLGKEKLAMVVTVAPLDKYYEENINVLSFASIARDIVFRQPPVKQHSSRYSLINYVQSTEESARDRAYIERLEEENMLLRAEIDRIKAENFIAMQQMEDDLRKKLTDSFKETLRINMEQCENRLEKKLFIQKREFEAELASQKRKYEEKLEDLRDEYESDNSVQILE